MDWEAGAVEQELPSKSSSSSISSSERSSAEDHTVTALGMQYVNVPIVGQKWGKRGERVLFSADTLIHLKLFAYFA